MSARRHAVLREMGLAPIWRLRGAVNAAVETVQAEDAAANGPDRALQAASLATQALSALVLPPSDSQQTKPDPGERSSAAVLPDALGRAERIARLDWEALEDDIRACRTCRLCERRRQAVPGVGDREARWMFVGEGPGAEEDQRGEPFVGAAGRLLDGMLASVHLQRGEGVYIANAVKCRPPHNRTPEPDEIDACGPYLARQIALIRPRLIVALGRPAARALLKDDIAIGAARGKMFEYERIPVVVTYHPAYLLRNQRDKAKVWEDLCFARRLMAKLSGG